MPKNIHTPREELICGKIERARTVARLLKSVELMDLLADIQHDAERMEAKLISRKDEAAGQVWGDAKPAVFYCENGKSLKGLEQGALAVLANLMIETKSTSADFMIGNEKDGDFHFRCTRGKADAPADLDEIKRELDLKIYEYLLEVERSESIDFSAVNQFWRRQGALLGMRIAVNHLASTGRLSGVTNEGERTAEDALKADVQSQMDRERE